MIRALLQFGAVAALCALAIAQVALMIAKRASSNQAERLRKYALKHRGRDLGWALERLLLEFDASQARLDRWLGFIGCAGVFAALFIKLPDLLAVIPS